MAFYIAALALTNVSTPCAQPGGMQLKSVDLVSKEELFPHTKKLEAEEEEEQSSLKYVVKLQLEGDTSNPLFAENVVLADTGTCAGRANIPSFLGRISLASQALSGGDDQVGPREKVGRCDSE